MPDQAMVIAMPLDPLAKVIPGQPMRIPATAYNAFIDAVKATRGITQNIEGGPLSSRSSSPIFIKNTTAATIQRFGVLGIDAPLVDPTADLEAFKRHIAFTGSTPADATHTGKFAIALEPIAAGAIGKACVDGLCITKVKLPDPNVSKPEFADIDDGITIDLKAQHRGAAAVLWHEPTPAGGGTVWAVVRLGDSRRAGAFAITLVMDGGVAGTDTTPTTYTYTVTDAITTDSLGTAIDPTTAPHQWKRPSIGNYSQATGGLAHYDNMHALTIDWINEVSVNEAAV